MTALAACILFVLTQLVVPAPSAAWENALRESHSDNRNERRASQPSGLSPTSPATSPAAQPACTTAGDKQITITCRYKAIHASRSESQPQPEPRIALNRFVVSFSTNDESLMHIELTFTNEDTKPISDARTVYIAIDDDANRNYLRRALPHVDFRQLAPGKRRTYSERLLAGSFRPGDYIFHLWIPSPDPSRKFSAADNFLLSSAGVPSPRTGLNKLAQFTVRR